MKDRGRMKEASGARLRLLENGVKTRLLAILSNSGSISHNYFVDSTTEVTHDEDISRYTRGIQYRPSG